MTLESKFRHLPFPWRQHTRAKVLKRLFDALVQIRLRRGWILLAKLCCKIVPMALARGSDNWLNLRNLAKFFG